MLPSAVLCQALGSRAEAELQDVLTGRRWGEDQGRLTWVAWSGTQQGVWRWGWEQARMGVEENE